MKLTKTLAALCAAGTLLAFASCKDSSGDIDTSGTKWALTATVDGTSGIVAGADAIIDSSEGTTSKVVDNTDGGKTTSVGHELEIQQCGKRAFKEISGGLNNTEGFRTNIVLDLSAGKFFNSSTNRTGTAGMLFDFNKYSGVCDFFYLSFKPSISSNGSVTGVRAYFERYSGVKKVKDGIYSRHAAASALGSNYVQSSDGTWYSDLYTPAQNKTWCKTLASDTDYVWDSTTQTITIGVDVKQETTGTYNVKIGKITYTLTDGSTQTGVANFNKAWTTAFAEGTSMGSGGDPNGNSSISSYANWTHVSKNSSKNLTGGIMAYAFAPEGCITTAHFYTCSKKAASNATPEADTDYVNDWNIANEIDTREGVKDYIIYEEGGVEHEYIYY